jgi:hypothetical protein
MNELLIGILLCKRVIERVRERGTLTADEKAQIFQTIHLLSCRVFNKLGQAGQLLGTLTADEKAQIFQIFQTIHLLSCRVFNKLGQAGQLLGELEVPRVQDCDLKEECAYSDNE